MTDFHLAQVNIGRILAPLGDPALADFVAQLPEINALAERSPGFVWRLVDDGGADSTGLRPDERDDMLLINCSVWTSVQALKDFAYHTEHLRVLSRRREWFEKLADHFQALWWVPAGHRPTAAEAMERIAVLRAEGPGPRAFTFRDPYPAPGSAGSADSGSGSGSGAGVGVGVGASASASADTNPDGHTGADVSDGATAGVPTDGHERPARR